MTWKPIIAGVDISPEGAWAAATAWRLAQAAQASCHLVYVVRGTATPPGGAPGVPDDEAFRAAVLPVAREQLRQSLAGNAPPECLGALEIWFGQPGEVLSGLAAQREAALMVVGGKRHSRLDRWLAGSTALDLIRSSTVPTLVATTSVAEIRRVLVAVDLSPASRRTIQSAWRLAELAGAELRVLHALEPATSLGTLAPFPQPTASASDAVVALERILPAALAAQRDVERVIRPGWAWQVITEEVRQWDAHLVVVGSHRKDWMDRVMLGSVTEALLQELPASLLVVPPRRGAGARNVSKAQHRRRETVAR